jgi:hypothetical protein
MLRERGSAADCGVSLAAYSGGGKMIIKCEKRRDFTIISNEAARDGRLSFAARGLLAFLMSLPPGTVTDAEKPELFTADSEESVQSAMEELIRAGYVIGQDSGTGGGEGNG